MRSIRVRRAAGIGAAGLAALLSAGMTAVPAQASGMKLALFGLIGMSPAAGDMPVAEHPDTLATLVG
ncbi:hypothetical protein [Kitasatospora sp. GP82]|uniref:hypothetical protein n=1 Tax=Kitasatospora sp. GP82 TaxID=3035089 RepID=UPI0024736C79|nr:hypothetical protein [Kitasatospora sp. GP82]MDH6124446.1 hypothetical protein [Kitasatospora sp. GP82]